ncbi:MAG: GNAT family N-acetyltransferase [Chordicoccus sp.]
MDVPTEISTEKDIPTEIPTETSAEIVGAFILNHAQGARYEQADWKYQASPDRTAVLHLLATKPSLQGHGIGRRLLGEAVAIARQRGDRVLRLDTLTWNVPGQRLYEGFGFRCCGDVVLDYPSTGKIPFRMYEYEL